MTIDTTRLAEHFADKRWFGGRGRTIDEIEVLDETIVDDGPPALVFAILRVHLRGGKQWIYNAPLIVSEDGGARDAFEDPERMRVIGELMAHGHTLKGRNGTFLFGGPGLDPLSPPGTTSVRVIDSEQSNSSVVLDEDVIVKLFRRVEPGQNPDLELNWLLTNEGFEHVPPQVGEIVYEGEQDDAEVSIDLGIAQQHVSNASEGWADMLGELNRIFDEADARSDPKELREEIEGRESDLFLRITALGEATAALHVCLAREEMGTEFVPEPVGPHDLVAWADGAREMLARLLASDESLAEERPGIDELINEFAALKDDLGFKSRIHGDFHLGQVLFGNRGWLIIDFEGEPSRTLPERRGRHSALKDVAGMIRSFGYAGAVALFERVEIDSDEWKRLKPWADAWEEIARERFLAAYLSKSHEGRFLPGDREVLGTMLGFFELDKALYELEYELAHRPQWAWIPRDGIARILQRS